MTFPAITRKEDFHAANFDLGGVSLAAMASALYAQEVKGSIVPGSSHGRNLVRDVTPLYAPGRTVTPGAALDF